MKRTLDRVNCCGSPPPDVFHTTIKFASSKSVVTARCVCVMLFIPLIIILCIKVSKATGMWKCTQLAQGHRRSRGPVPIRCEMPPDSRIYVRVVAESIGIKLGATKKSAAAKSRSVLSKV